MIQPRDDERLLLLSKLQHNLLQDIKGLSAEYKALNPKGKEHLRQRVALEIIVCEHLERDADALGWPEKKAS